MSNQVIQQQTLINIIEHYLLNGLTVDVVSHKVSTDFRTDVGVLVKKVKRCVDAREHKPVREQVSLSDGRQVIQLKCSVCGKVEYV